MANEKHKDLGCRGINAFQTSGLLSYRYAPSGAAANVRGNPVHV